jgi:AcrR family transcriptional regulator
VSDVNTKHEGRPQDPAISQALFQAAERRMVSDGFSKLTVDSLVTEVGTTRQSFYRRYPNLSTLALEVLLLRFGNGEEVNTGSLETDLLRLQRDEVAMMTTPLVQKNLPGLLEDMRVTPESHDTYRDRIVTPRRLNIGRVIERAKERGEIGKKDVDVEYVCDLLVGPILARVLLPTGLPLDDEFARRTVATVLSELT